MQMHPTHLQALRRLLGYSPPEAARWLARDEERPRGVQERTWNRWEAGEMPIPPNIGGAVLGMVAWLEQEIKRLRAEQVHHLATPARPGTTRGPFLVLWFSAPEDCGHPAKCWRPMQSAASQFLAESPPGAVQLVPFDAAQFNQWRAALRWPDAPHTRAQWAAVKAEENGPG